MNNQRVHFFVSGHDFDCIDFARQITSAIGIFLRRVSWLGPELRSACTGPIQLVIWSSKTWKALKAEVMAPRRVMTGSNQSGDSSPRSCRRSSVILRSFLQCRSTISCRPSPRRPADWVAEAAPDRRQPSTPRRLQGCPKSAAIRSLRRVACHPVLQRTGTKCVAYLFLRASTSATKRNGFCGRGSGDPTRWLS